MRKNITITLLCIIILLMTGYLTYTYFHPLKEEVTSTKTIINVKGTDINKLSNIITNELSILDPLKSLDELSNQAQLSFAIDTYLTKNNLNKESKYPNITFTSTDLENIYKNTSLGNIPFNHESLEDPFKENNEIYLYDNFTKTYHYNEKLEGHGLPFYEKATKYLVSYSSDNDKYVISYQYLWISGTEGGYQKEVYATYADMIANQNSLFELSNSSDPYSKGEIQYQSAQYLAQNYENIKNKLPIYTYAFNQNYQIIDFKVSSL